MKLITMTLQEKLNLIGSLCNLSPVSHRTVQFDGSSYFIDLESVIGEIVEVYRITLDCLRNIVKIDTSTEPGYEVEINGVGPP